MENAIVACEIALAYVRIVIVPVPSCFPSVEFFRFHYIPGRLLLHEG